MSIGPHAKLNDVRAMNYPFKQFNYCLVSDVSSEATVGQSGWVVQCR